jgi:hypothetical protein
MNLDNLHLFELRTLYIRMNGHKYLEKILEKDLPNNLPLESIIDHYTKVIGEKKCREHLINKLQPQVNVQFTNQIQELYKKFYDNNFKLLYQSKPDDMNIYSNNEFENQRKKNHLAKIVLSKANQDDTKKPLIFLKQTLRLSILGDFGPLFITNSEFLIYQIQKLYTLQEHVQIYGDKDDFLHDTKYLIQKMDRKNTNGYFHLGLLTLNDEKQAPPPLDLDLTKVA